MAHRIAYVSHSLVAHRQAAWAEIFRKKLAEYGITLDEVYPSQWARHSRSGGHSVDRPGDMTGFRWPDSVYAAWEKDAPSLVLIQNEAYCASTVETAVWCDEHKVPYVTFSWENAHGPPTPARWVYQHAAHNIFGNSTSLKLATTGIPNRPACSILPQVGIDDSLFKPRPSIKIEWDILFMGRKSEPMKGETLLDQSVRGSEWIVRKGHELGFAEYAQVAMRYNRASVICSPSVDLPDRPLEQFAPAVNVEALLSGAHVVTSNQSAIFEWLRGCPGVWWTKMGDSHDLRNVLLEAFEARSSDPNEWLKNGLRARAWCQRRFSNEVVADKYARLLAPIALGFGDARVEDS